MTNVPAPALIFSTDHDGNQVDLACVRFDGIDSEASGQMMAVVTLADPGANAKINELINQVDAIKAIDHLIDQLNRSKNSAILRDHFKASEIGIIRRAGMNRLIVMPLTKSIYMALIEWDGEPWREESN